MGVAVSDELGMTAQPLETITRKDANKFRRTYARMEELVREYQVEKIVLGFPKNMKNTVGERGDGNGSFRDALVRRIGMAVIMWDERLSTVASKKVLMESGVRRENRKKVIDQVAASIILQGYLDSRGRKDDKMKATIAEFSFTQGREIEFMVLEQTTLAGTNYLLMADSVEDDGVVLIMKEISLEEDYVSYEIVEDEEELEIISKIFNELIEDFDLTV